MFFVFTQYYKSSFPQIGIAPPWSTDTLIAIRYNFDLTIDDSVDKNYYYLTMSFPVYLFNHSTNQYEIYTNQYTEILTGDLPKHQLYLNNGLLFNDDEFNGSGKKISGTATTFTRPWGDFSDVEEDMKYDKSKLYIKLYSLSSDAYYYFSGYARQMATENDVYSEPTPIYSNIENGLGIFAGENITSEELVIQY
ncbi:MAG: DUF4249 family protein [Bacteroidales bacterium]|nr:DUF4249 family protein [Bacteroidales bacterium]